MAAHNLALTATGLVALAFHAPIWAADLLMMITTSCLDDPLAMAAGGAVVVSAYYYALLLASAVSFFVAVIRLHLALISPAPVKGLAAATKAARTTVVDALTAAALVAVSLNVLFAAVIAIVQFW
ncbi:hypothetical protein SETIT_8G181600v2 [Setaria italica]|uniref:Uncharacterized protein n=1 Tax=Setaria italica TaxID=4555 RepID=A0A368S930_SETIT|nr:hypothetical protein SETIT_8G181600v2 [Setaria italica]